MRVDTRSQDQPARYAEQFLQDAPLNAIVEYYDRSRHFSALVLSFWAA